VEHEILSSAGGNVYVHEFNTHVSLVNSHFLGGFNETKSSWVKSNPSKSNQNPSKIHQKSIQIHQKSPCFLGASPFPMAKIVKPGGLGRSAAWHQGRQVLGQLLGLRSPGVAGDQRLEEGVPKEPAMAKTVPHMDVGMWGPQDS
jgi:hypothetical protein